MNYASHYSWKSQDFGNDMAIVFYFSPSTDILWNLLPYPSTDFPLYSQQQKRDLKHNEGGILAIFSLHIWRRACSPARDHPNS